MGWGVEGGRGTALLKACCDEINSDLDVEGLCRDFPKRICQLVKNEGGRLKE